jgi:hypothetical protein
MDKVIFVNCPKCDGEYYVERSDYMGHPEALCHCPFCHHEFAVIEGKPRPWVTAGAPTH